MNNKFEKHLSMPAVWAFSIGTSIGWGSLVVTCSTYLAQAGPLGSTLGLVVGAIIMLVISMNYSYMIRSFPESGGAYSFTREQFGYDYGFIAAWFLSMTYLAILWANATALPLFSRMFLGKIFQFGRLYKIFGYDVYIGEALLSIAAVVLTGLLCMGQKRITNIIMIALAGVFTIGIVVSFIGSVVDGGSFFSPAFKGNTSALSQIVKIAVISPWAFIGFESISHGAEEYTFETRKIRKVLMISVVSTLILYVMVTLLSVTSYPDRYSGWLEYIRDLDNLDGIEALPAFYAADRLMGSFGVTLLTIALLALVITSLIGNIFALSRLFYSMAKDNILPKKLGELNKKNIPANAILLVVAVSSLIPFVGRTAIGWIVDVTTIGATLIYGFVSASTVRMAKEMKDDREKWTGRIGLFIMILFGIYILAPNIVSKGSIAKETYFLFIVWSVLGFLFFRRILRNDRERRFGTSIIVWVVMLSLILFIALIWMRQSMISSDENMQKSVEEYYAQSGDPNVDIDTAYMEELIDDHKKENTKTILMALGMFGFALIIMLNNHSYMNKRANESEQMANTDTMTGVKNKHAFIGKEKAVNDSIDDGSVREFAVVVCDVNGLKKINDTLGHKAGDEYIIAACKMVCEIFQHSPVYRVGGDEFVAVLTGRDYIVREELVKLLHDRSVRNIETGDAVVSGGMSDFDPEKDTNFHAVFERADTLMYEEKKLLKSMGAATRDDEEPEEETEPDVPAEFIIDPIINVRRHILIVDDEKINQMMLGSILAEDYEVLYASDGIEAWAAVQEHKDELALILLDLMMPRMSGTELLEKLKDEADTKLIPVIVLTADQKSEVECLQMGAMDFIQKPYPLPAIIKARVNKCIELSEDRNIIQSTERDSLTKLFNIDYFVRYVQMFDQHYEFQNMDAVIVDVNRFHMINERYGKTYGDTVLKRLGERIRQMARKMGGVGCRRGADTFLIYAPHRDDYSELIEKLTEDIEKDETKAGKIKLRMGVYAEVDKKLDIERRFDRAKMAADNVKGNYTNVVGIYDSEIHESALFRERLLEDFESSLEQKCFTVFFQPKFDIRPDKPILASAEALVRWKHPELGMISPGIFIPLLEENGMILSLDRYVWEETARQIRNWKDTIGFSVPVSVNVSRIDMLMPDLKEVFAEIIDKYGISTEDIMLEITESAYTGDSEQVISTARELRGMGMGFRIEMDDFGTGYSSLGMLNNLPIDALKLDMSFVRNAFGKNKDMRMIELIIDIADYLHVPVVAEGVETKEQYMTLKAMGCDLIQGYYFSKPVPCEEFTGFLNERKQQHREELKDMKKNYTSISKALTYDFESIFYIDTFSDYYLEFYSGENGELKIYTGGTNFFVDAPEKIAKEVSEADRAGLLDALKKENMLKWSSEDDALILTYSRKKDGESKNYSLNTLCTRNRDDHHIVIGVRPE